MGTYEVLVEQVDKFSKSFTVEASSPDEAERLFHEEYPDLDLATASNALDDCDQTITVKEVTAS